VVAVKEGVEAWRGEGCCVSSPLEGVGFSDGACEEDCCAPALAGPVSAGKPDDDCC
jgi:hypothetical protein